MQLENIVGLGKQNVILIPLFIIPSHSLLQWIWF